LQEWAYEQREKMPRDIRDRYEEKMQKLETDRDEAVSDVSSIVAMKLREKREKLLASFDADVREELDRRSFGE
jgi:hypothetical protein